MAPPVETRDRKGHHRSSTYCLIPGLRPPHPFTPTGTTAAWTAPRAPTASPCLLASPRLPCLPISPPDTPAPTADSVHLTVPVLASQGPSAAILEAPRALHGWLPSVPLSPTPQMLRRQESALVTDRMRHSHFSLPPTPHAWPFAWWLQLCRPPPPVPHPFWSNPPHGPEHLANPQQNMAILSFDTPENILCVYLCYGSCCSLDVSSENSNDDEFNLGA